MIPFKEAVEVNNAPITVIGQNGTVYEGYYYPGRVSPATIPDNWRLYDFISEPSKMVPLYGIVKHATENFGGSFLTKTEILFDSNELLLIDHTT